MSYIGDRCFMLLQRALPKHALSRLVYRLMRSEQPWLRDRLLRFFLSNYHVQMDEAIESNPFSYKSFNAFFTRALKPATRPIEGGPNTLVSPVDGTVSQCGRIDDHAILQAKGRQYSLVELLGGAERAAKYRGGSFACIYLAPYNYHRIHMPLSGTVHETLYIPGDLFSVNAATARSVPRLFARNERVVCDFKSSDALSFAMVYVGALFVGSMETTWCGEVNPPPRIRKQATAIPQGIGTPLAKGDEAGRFNMGSTVILVFPQDCVEFDVALKADAVVKVGQRIGTLNVTRDP